MCSNDTWAPCGANGPSGSGPPTLPLSVARALTVYGQIAACRPRRPGRRFDMKKVLVVYASRHGATRGIAQRIGDVLRTEGLEVDIAPAEHAAGAGAADAVVV